MNPTHESIRSYPKIHLLTSAQPGKLESKAVDIFQHRVADLGGAILINPGDTASEDTLTILAGVYPSDARMEKALKHFRLQTPYQPESFLLCHDPQREAKTVLVCGADGQGLLYGLGRLLHQMSINREGISLPPIQETQVPAIQERGVYFATHFNNFYECAPMNKICQYIEEMALWGYNLLHYWFDMNWFPYGFWDDPESPGMAMIKRLRQISDTAHACGMRVGSCGIANEGFSFQPPPELRADISARRGGFYPYSQICPSKPGGLEMILNNRRKVLELLGPFEYYWHWPYDQGGCGCPECSDEQHRWGRTFIELGRHLSPLVKEFNPQVKFILSTWLMEDVERQMVYDLCERGEDWFDGVISETKHFNEHTLGSRYAHLVFPEISMFDCYYTSYGCNGANPAPLRFTAEARQMAAANLGAVLYSEGMYEDINKVIWASLLWSPQREAYPVVEEYCRYYFGSQNREPATDLVMALESTWGSRKLSQTSTEEAQRLLEGIRSLKGNLPDNFWCHDRWQTLHDRAEMDWWMVQIGSQKEMLRAARLLFEEAASTHDVTSLREHASTLLSQLTERQQLIDHLFDAYWRYLQYFGITRTELIFIPDEMIGRINLQPLQEALSRALDIEDNAVMQEEVVKACKKWFWCSGIDIDFLFI